MTGTFAHGWNGYSRHKCRCEVCRAASRNMRRQMRHNQRQRATLRTARPTPGDGWRDQAACRDAPPAIFYDDNENSRNHARRYCDDCPVRTDCLTHALANREEGVWGGTDEDERDRIRERRNIA